MKFIIQSFPRSGANFLANNLRQSCDKYVGISHHAINLHPDKTIIHLIRNPIDSISSIIWVNEKINGLGDLGMPSQVHLYNKMYEFILSKNDYIMCFDKLIFDPEGEIAKLLQFRNLPVIAHSMDLAESKPEMGFHSSSQNNSRYQEIYDAVSKYESDEMTYAYELYTKALALCA